MAAIVPSSYSAFESGTLAPASGQDVRYKHVQRLVENLNRLRATIGGTVASWCGTYSTTSTSYQTVAKGVCYQPITIYSDGVQSTLKQIIVATNADVRITLAALGGGSTSTAVTSFTAKAVKESDHAANSAILPGDAMEWTIEVKVPAAGTAEIFAVTLECKDQDAATLR